MQHSSRRGRDSSPAPAGTARPYRDAPPSDPAGRRGTAIEGATGADVMATIAQGCAAGLPAPLRITVCDDGPGLRAVKVLLRRADDALPWARWLGMGAVGRYEPPIGRQPGYTTYAECRTDDGWWWTLTGPGEPRTRSTPSDESFGMVDYA